MASLRIDALFAGAALYAVRQLFSVVVAQRDEKKRCAKVEPEPCPEPLPDEGDLGGSLRYHWCSQVPGVCAFFAVLLVGFLAGLFAALDGELAPRAATFVENGRPGHGSGGLVLAATNSSANEPAAVVELKRQRIVEQTPDGHARWKTAYYGTLEVGSPGVSFSLLFDTGSGHLVLPSTYCHSETCRAHKRYSRSKSSSAVDMNADGGIVEAGQDRDEIVVSYGTGDVAGVVVEDVVCLEKDVVEGQLVPRSEVSADHDQALGPGCSRLRLIVATEMSAEPFGSFKFDGILGLGLSGLSQGAGFNFLHVVGRHFQEWGGVMPYTFGIFLEEGATGHSEIALGGWSSDRIEGDLFWNDVAQPELGHWLVNIKEIRIGDDVLPFCEKAAGGCKGVVDSGTSLLSVPPEAFPEIFEGLRHMAQLDGACRGSGPQLHIKLEHFTVTLGPADYAVSEHVAGNRGHGQMEGLISDDELAQRRLAEGKTRTDFRCKPMLMSLSIPEPVGPSIFVLGEPVLRKYYTVYDAQGPSGNQPRVGFAKAARPVEESFDSIALDHEESIDEWFFEASESEVTGESM